uniref:Uncharacterized protein n=1 Tax=Arundo donax TaxID=35708 RepID=A0A0A9CUV1_ARUDO
MHQRIGVEQDHARVHRPVHDPIARRCRRAEAEAPRPPPRSRRRRRRCRRSGATCTTPAPGTALGSSSRSCPRHRHSLRPAAQSGLLPLPCHW